MKAISILIIASVNFAIADAQSSSRQFIYWENLSAEQQSVILTGKKYPSFFISFYNNPKAVVDTLDDQKVFSILDSIVSNVNPVLQPFYYNLFIKMCLVSDGYLGEVMGGYSINLLLAEPEYVINHIRLERMKNNDNLEFNYLVDNISFEYQGEQNEDYPGRPNWSRFTSLLKGEMVNASEENKKVLNELLNKIKKVADSYSEEENDDDK